VHDEPVLLRHALGTIVRGRYERYLVTRRQAASKVLHHDFQPAGVRWVVVAEHSDAHESPGGAHVPLAR
jgi:hypothetical protein